MIFNIKWWRIELLVEIFQAIASLFDTVPFTNMSDLQNDARRKQRRQSAVKLRRLSVPSPAADEEQIITAAEMTLDASRSCYRIIFALAAVRIGATLIDERIWFK